MKIGLFTDTYVPQVNGVVTVVRTLKEGLEARGHEVSIVTVSHPDAVPMPGVHRIPSVKFPPEPQHRFGIFGGTIAVALVRKLGLDIIHTHTEFTLNAAAVTAGRLCKIPVISTLHTYYPDYVHYIPLIGGMIQGSMSPLMRIAFARKACIVAPSGKIRDFLLDCAIATPMEVVPNCSVSSNGGKNARPGPRPSGSVSPSTAGISISSSSAGWPRKRTCRRLSSTSNGRPTRIPPSGSSSWGTGRTGRISRVSQPPWG
jgi:glycosyltransferase involved in cell wall biosynthesis